MKTVLNERIELAKSDKSCADSIITEYTPFLKALVRNYIPSGRHYLFDDYLSVAMEAFYEAIKSFNSQKGYFISFAKLVVKRRLINLTNNIKKRKEVNFTDLSYADSDGNIKDFEAIDNKNLYFDNTCRLEIEAIKDECLQFNIDFFKLEKHSPKAAKTKEQCARIINYIIHNSKVQGYIKRNNALPLKQITETLNISRKIAERHRKYIIAAAIIAAGDYPCISGYLNLKEEVKL